MQLFDASWDLMLGVYCFDRVVVLCVCVFHFVPAVYGDFLRMIMEWNR